jgi:hypothetical protein
MEEMERNPFGEVRLQSPAGLLFSHIEDVREAPPASEVQLPNGTRR